MPSPPHSFRLLWFCSFTFLASCDSEAEDKTDKSLEEETSGIGGTESNDEQLGVGGAGSPAPGDGGGQSVGAQSGMESGGSIAAAGGTKGSGDGGAKAAGGSPSDGGSPGAEATGLCGSAEEGEAITLSCPKGEVIDSVVFASYGTPEGSCEDFSPGECHAETSETFVDSLCTGRSSCTIAAANASFGDPCNSVPKSLAVEVTCIVGEPTVEPTGPYKGVANSPANELAALGATWCYNWMTSPQVSDCSDPAFVPMIWGGGDVSGALEGVGNAGYTTLLAFNEPNKSDQANMSVAEALDLWSDLTSNSNIRVSSPAVSDDGRAWLEEFMDGVQTRGLRVDFIAMHWYGWNEGSCTASQLEGAVTWASQWGLPVWITEFGCMGSSNADEQTLLDFFGAVLPMLAAHPLVERYAWYPWNTYNNLYLPDENEDRVVTALGEAFASAPQYR